MIKDSESIFNVYLTPKHFSHDTQIRFSKKMYRDTDNITEQIRWHFDFPREMRNYHIQLYNSYRYDIWQSRII